MEFISSNGARKTTTIKLILNLIHIDSGEVSILGKNFTEIELKQKVGSAFGGVDNTVLQISILIVGITIFTIFTMIAYNIAVKRFEKVEI